MIRLSKNIGASVFLGLLLLILGLSSYPSPYEAARSAERSSVYFPGKGDLWEKRTPEELGMNSGLLQEAIDYAMANEWQGPKDLKSAITQSFGSEPYSTLIGPTKLRGGAAGIIIKNGYIVAEWGDTKRVDMTFSVTKSYLSTMAGLALDQGLIHDVNDPVKDYVRDGKFDSEHNSKITWHHLLQQTSDWSGILWEKPDWADRPPRDTEWDDARNRELKEPGSYFKYNDVRVNLLAYSLLQLWRRPLPVLLREKIMDPIDASPTWQWHGYENSWIDIDGQKIQSVSGGGHWGGGMFISTRDHARFGLLFLRKGKWNRKQLISENWIDMMRIPSSANPAYGYMWWLNTNKRAIPSASESVYYAAGFGGNFIVVDNEHDLVVVVRWTGSSRTANGIMMRILASMEVNTPSLVKEKKKDDARTKYADFVGYYRFAHESEEMLISFYLEDGVLSGTGEYSLGELKPVKGNDLKFKVETEYGEKWSFEFVKDDKGKIVKCRFMDEDFAEMGSVTGVKVIKEAKKSKLDLSTQELTDDRYPI
jgi:CubicO group peptidase (beta-lactamase class C family)